MPTKTKKVVKKSPVKKVAKKPTKPAAKKPAKAPGKVKKTITKKKTKTTTKKTPVKKAKKGGSKFKEFLKAKQVQLVAGLALIAAVWVLFMPQRATGISYFETWRLSAGESIKMQLGRK